MSLSEGLLNAVEKRLREHHGLTGGRVEEDRVVVALDPDNTRQVWVTSVDHERLVSVQVRSARRAHRSAWPTVLRTLNEWNRRNRLTSAWLAVDDWELSSHGVVVLDAALPLDTDAGPVDPGDFLDAVLTEVEHFGRIVPAG